MTLEEQLNAAKVGDELELRNGRKLEISVVYPDGFIASDGMLFRPDGRMYGEPDNEWWTIVRVIPKLEDGWVEWRGGECPLEQGTVVDVKFLDGSSGRHTENGDPYSYGWRNGRICAYRVVEPPKPSYRKRLEELRLELMHCDRPAVLGRLLDLLIERESA